MRGGSNKVRYTDWCRMHTNCHQTRDVGDIHKEIGTDRIRDLSHLLEIDDPWIGGRSSGDHPRLMLLRLTCQLVVIDTLGLAIYSIVNNRIETPGKIRFVTVGKMAPMRQVHR